MCTSKRSQETSDSIDLKGDAVFNIFMFLWTIIEHVETQQRFKRT